jgi:hypothetical protein
MYLKSPRETWRGFEGRKLAGKAAAAGFGYDLAAGLHGSGSAQPATEDRRGRGRGRARDLSPVRRGEGRAPSRATTGQLRKADQYMRSPSITGVIWVDHQPEPSTPLPCRHALEPQQGDERI